MNPTKNNSRERADHRVIIGSFGQNPKLSSPEAQVIFRTLARSICGLLMLVISASALFAAEPPSLTINDVAVSEGDHGAVVAVFTVSLSAPSDEEVNVRYATVDDTAKAGADFTLASGVLTIPPGKSSAQIVVLVASNASVEDNRRFFLQMSDVEAVVPGRMRGTGTIIDDDGSNASK